MICELDDVAEVAVFVIHALQMARQRNLEAAGRVPDEYRDETVEPPWSPGQTAP
ncbi:MAG TPA: hypothetical protein VK923_13630 [Euzebyales bacterium]|nr:hypothetical protein [Euzebyales bacterium]